MEKENRKTVVRLSRLTNRRIRALAEEASIPKKPIKWYNKGSDA
jgi:hypothetical protein